MLRQMEILKSSAPRASIQEAVARPGWSPCLKKSLGLNAWKSSALAGWSEQVIAHRDLNCVGVTDKRDLCIPAFSLDDSSYKDGTVHGVRSGDKGSIRRPTMIEQRQIHFAAEHAALAYLRRRKNVDFGELVNGSPTLWTRLQFPASQILTVLSSDCTPQLGEDMMLQEAHLSREKVAHRIPAHTFDKVTM